uniref:Xylulose kinase-1 n=1 Tax=Tanacetum cinerariifolium TaxID=118510 RepID=A0A6L2MGK9_TANCI|nr:hypothetical protein [Tanacetum cinerariifolium]
MSTLKFAEVHNLVAFLSKPTESEGFEQIADFLNANPIKYVLTVNPIVYTSCIEQFWATVKVKTVNREVQLQALVDGKKVIITESTIIRDLQLEDVEDEAVNEEMDDSLVRAATSASSLEVEHDSGNINKTQYKATPNESSSQGTDSSGGPRCQDTMGDTAAQTRSERVSKFFNDSLLAGVNIPRSDEDRLKLNELMKLCTNLQNMVIDLENTKTTQALKIESLKRRVKKLEKKQRSRTQKLKRLYKVGLTARVKSFEDEGLGEEDASKQRRITDIDADEGITLVKQAKEVIDDITLAKALMEIKSVKPTADKVVIQEPEQVSSQQPSQVKVQDKGKAKMIEEPVKLKKKDQIFFDEEVTKKLQDEINEEKRLTRERARLAEERDQQKQEANIALIETWDDI